MVYNWSTAWSCQSIIPHDIHRARQDRKDHDNVIKWKHFPRYWPFLRGIHRWPMNYPHKSHWRGALMFHWICAWINGCANNREAGDLRRHRAHYDVTVMPKHLREIPIAHNTLKPTNDKKHDTIIADVLSVSLYQKYKAKQTEKRTANFTDFWMGQT